MKDLNGDGIWKVDYDTGKGNLIYSLKDIINVETKEIFASCLHKINHVRINKTGSGFILFIVGIKGNGDLID